MGFTPEQIKGRIYGMKKTTSPVMQESKNF